MNLLKRLQLNAALAIAPRELSTVLRGRIELFDYYRALTLPPAETLTYVRAYIENDTIAAVQDWKSQKVASVPWFVNKVVDQKAFRAYKKLSSSKEKQQQADAAGFKRKALEEIERPDLMHVLDYPNDKMTGDELFYALDVMWDVAGNGLIWGNRLQNGANKGQIRELHWLPTLWVTMEGGSLMTSPISYTLLNSRDKMLAGDVLHLRRFNADPRDGQDTLWGRSRLEPLRKSVIAKSSDADEYEVETFQNRGARDLVFPKGSSLDDFSPEGVQSIQEALTRKLKQRGTGGIVANAVELGSIRVGSSPVDMNLDPTRQRMLEITCANYHIRTEVLASTVKSTYNNLTESRKISLTDAVIPDVFRLRDKLNQWLVPAFNTATETLYLDADLDVFPELQEDQKTKAEYLSKLPLSMNQRLEAFGFEASPDPMMQEPMIPTGFTPLSEMKAPPEQNGQQPDNDGSYN